MDGESLTVGGSNHRVHQVRVVPFRKSQVPIEPADEQLTAWKLKEVVNGNFSGRHFAQ